MLPAQVQGSTYLERKAGQPLDTFETYWGGFLIKTIPSGQDTGSFQSLNSNSSSCPGSRRNHTIGNSRPVSPEQQLAGWSPRSAQKQCTESSRGLSQPETSPINLTNVRVVHSLGQARELACVNRKPVFASSSYVFPSLQKVQGEPGQMPDQSGKKKSKIQTPDWVC